MARDIGASASYRDGRRYLELPAQVFKAIMMSSTWRDRYTLCAFERFIRSFGIVQTAFSKSTSSQTACCSSLFRTIVSR